MEWECGSQAAAFFVPRLHSLRRKDCLPLTGHKAVHSSQVWCDSSLLESILAKVYQNKGFNLFRMIELQKYGEKIVQ
jgi:hypothetical protein